MAGRVAILGCGYVGLELGRQLTDAHAVVGVRRSPEGVAAIEAAGFEAVQSDLADPTSRSSLPDADIVVFAASPGRGGDARTLYVDALSGVIDEYAARDSPPDRLLYTSSTGVYGNHDGGWVDEHTRIFPDSDRQRLLLEAERLAMERTADRGIDGTVVRFGGLYGPDRYRLERYLEGPVTEGYLNLIHRDDAAGAVRFLVETDRGRDEVVIAVDTEPVDRWTFADWLAAECGVLPPSKQTVEERLADTDITPAARHRITANKRCSSETLQSMGYEFDFPTAREGYRPAIEDYLESED